MKSARCSCGAVMVSLAEQSSLVVACHCIDCQRRTGAPFGAGAFYPAEAVTVSGSPKEYVRVAASGGKVHSYFCANCGSTVFWRSTNLPAFIGIAVGAMADPASPAPFRSVFEQSKHGWVEIGGAGVEHFQQGSGPRKSD